MSARQLPAGSVHAGAEPARPNALGTVETPARCRCGSPRHTTDPDRCASGHTWPANRVAVTTAFDAQELPPELAHLHREVQDFLGGCLVDEGDPDDVPTRRRALLDYRARVHRRILQLDAALELRGLVDRRGRLRAAWLQRLEGLVGTARALDAQLGLERRPRRLNVAEQLARFHDGRRRAR